MAIPNRILLIEDEPGDAELVRIYLSDGASLGFGAHDLKAVTRIAEAEVALARESFDVVLLDLHVPDSSGLASLHRIQAAAPMLPIVILTGLDDRELGEQAIAAGAQDYLPKALLDADRLARAVRYAMRRARMNKRLRAVVANNVDAMVVVGTDDGLVKFANGAATRLFDKPLSEMVGTPFPYDVGAASVTEIEVGGEDRRRAAEMRVSYLEWDGEAAYLASLRDITDRKRAEDLQRRLIHSDRLAAIGQLAAGVAHEVNNPAQYILENLRQLETALGVAKSIVATCSNRTLGAEDGEPPLAFSELGAQHELPAWMAELERIHAENRRGMERIVEIVRDLRSFARSDRNTIAMVNVNEAVQVACNMTGNQIRHRAELRIELGDLPPIAADRGKLSQVFTNLLLNAAHAIEEGAAESNHITVSTALVDNAIRVSVEDSGSGIPDHIKGQIFEPFFTTKPREVGTGLGLPLTADIVRQHGGDIDVDSTVGHGTRFDVFLPLRTSLELAEGEQPPDEAPGDHRARLLIIDDEIQLLHAFERMLRREHDVVAVRGGESAIQCLSVDAEFDVIICDLMMPQVDGKQVYEHLKSHHPDLTSRVVFCSGGAFTARVRKFLDDTGCACLDKPVARKDLLRTVSQVVASHDSTELAGAGE